MPNMPKPPTPLPSLASSLPPLVDGEEWAVFESGWVWLAGAGPGDPGLISLHVLNGLRQADHVVYDALIDKRILAWAQPTATIEYAGKRGGKPSPTQRNISLRLIELARAGKKVLRLKGGDPFVFARGGEEAQMLIAANIPLRIIPGISAGIGGLAYAGIPLTHRDTNQSVTFITGHDRDGLAPSAINWRGVALGSQVIVLYMAIKHLAHITTQLLEAGRDPNEAAAIVSNATLADMRVIETSLGQLADEVAQHGITPPAIIVIGEVVLMRQCLDWLGYMAGAQPRNLDPLGYKNAGDANKTSA